jgi:hypothetical protein
MSVDREVPTREYEEAVTVRLTRFRDMGALEDAVTNNGEDLEDIRKLIARQNESHEGLKRRLADKDVELERQFGDLKAYMAGKFGELQGYQQAEQRGATDRKWIWTTVLALTALAASLVFNVWSALHR